MNRLTTIALFLAATGCGSASAGRQEYAREQSSECLRREALARYGGEMVFSSVLTDTITEDQSGIELRLYAKPQGWAGSFREAAGELGTSQALVNLRVDESTQQISFVLPNAADSSHFEGWIACDSIWGMFRAYRTTPAERMTLQRVPLKAH
jgi:hypothetical protein